MPRIRCYYIDCVFLDDGFCGTAAVEVDPDEGCMTYKQASALLDEDLELVEEEWEDLGFDEEEDEDLWLDEDEDF